MIKKEIIENPALQSLARTLRYFIRERKYGYADDIRNARKDSRDFEETIAKMLREGELRRVQQEQDRQAGKEVKNWIYLPKEDEIKEVFRLANEDFESTKLALVMLAFSFPSRSEEEGEKK
jgi:CRISPR type I-A-associated protein Csa5